MFDRIWEYLQAIVEAFVADDALSRGASISFYTATSIGPVLFIVVAIAGLAFGEDAARGAVSEQLSDLMGKETADFVQKAVQSASGTSTGIIATGVGIITLVITASAGQPRGEAGYQGWAGHPASAQLRRG
jgi:membrane protein